MALHADLESVRAWLQQSTGLATRISAKPVPGTRAGLELWSWRIEDDLIARNRPSPVRRPGPASQTAPLKLYFLVLSARGIEGLDQAFQALHGQHVLAAGERRLLLKPHPLDIGQSSALFLASQSPLRPFLSYELGNG